MTDPSQHDPFIVTETFDAEELDEDDNPFGMSEFDKDIADTVYEAMMESMRRSDRSAQAQEFRVGISDFGYCSERLRRFLDRQVPDDTDMLAAWIGTWLGTGVEESFKVAYPEAVIQSEITITLHGETNTYVVPGHPDIIYKNTVLDAKSANGLVGASRTGMTDQQKKFQRHGYGFAAWTDGLLGDIDLDDVRVGNLWIDRSGTEKRLLVKTEPLDMEVIEEATRWLDEVVYNWQRGTEAEKEPAREVCATTCGFFSVCRAFDTDVQGLLTDTEKLDAVAMQLEGAAMVREGKKLQSAAKDALADIVGTTGEHSVRWIHVAPSFIEGYKRAGYSRLQVSKIKKDAPKKRAAKKTITVEQQATTLLQEVPNETLIRMLNEGETE